MSMKATLMSEVDKALAILDPHGYPNNNVQVDTEGGKVYIGAQPVGWTGALTYAVSLDSLGLHKNLIGRGIAVQIIQKAMNFVKLDTNEFKHVYINNIMAGSWILNLAGQGKDHQRLPEPEKWQWFGSTVTLPSVRWPRVEDYHDTLSTELVVGIACDRASEQHERFQAYLKC